MKIQISLAFAESFRAKLVRENVPGPAIDSILAVVEVGPSLRDPSAKAYARSMERSYDEYGLSGLSTQVLYFLMNARGWVGPESKTHKTVLNKWAKSIK